MLKENRFHLMGDLSSKFSHMEIEIFKKKKNTQRLPKGWITF